MTSTLIITSVENLQDKITDKIIELKGKPCVYISLNKSQKSMADILSAKNINENSLFFIDCVSSSKDEDAIHLGPSDLEMLAFSIKEFLNQIKGEKYLIIDALSTLLIFNSENNVIKFTKSLTEFATGQGVQIISFSPKTEGEEMLNKIFNFFDKVEK